MTYTNFPGGPFGHGLYPSTFSPQINKNPIGDSGFKKSPNLKIEEIPEILLHNSQLVSVVALKKVMEDINFHIDLNDLPIFFYPSIDALIIDRLLRGSL